MKSQRAIAGRVTWASRRRIRYGHNDAGHATNRWDRYRAVSKKLNSQTYSSQPTIYQIRIKGHLGAQWTDWFAGLTITREDNGDTLLTGPVVDQAALHGLLKKVRDLGVPLLSVNSEYDQITTMVEGKR